jgi:mannose-6-phosphate isomerase-like protein (cupin superfamily)
MVEFAKKSFDDPDDVQEYPLARTELVKVGGNDVWRMIAEPGWRYSQSMGPADGTVSCQAEHVFWLMISGRLAVQLDGGPEKEFGPGDVGSIPPGHEAWVIGEEPVVAIDFYPGE